MNLLYVVLCLVIAKVSSDQATDKDLPPPFHIHRPHKNTTEIRQFLPIINPGNGPVMTAPVAYLIFYGTWSYPDKRNVLNFVKGLGATPWWSLNVQYGAGILTFGGYTTDPDYSQGKSISDSQIFPIVTNALNKNLLPRDPNGIYMVLTSSDVSIPNFCTKFCGWHTYDVTTSFKYSFVGTPSASCNCYTEKISPNGNIYVDAMMSIIAHELAETVTDPFLNAWADSSKEENADKCAWNYLFTSLAPNGAKYNVHVGLNKYLIQSNWNLRTQQCALLDDAFPLLSVTQRISSPNRFYYLTMQTDNNLVIYRYSDNVAVWATSTVNSCATKAIFQSDGNFVVYNNNWAAVWNTVTWGNTGAYLNMQDDGNLVVYTTADRAIWASNSISYRSFWLTLITNERLDSPTKLYYLVMQSDQNLVIYRYSDNTAIWSTGTKNSGATIAAMQYDGNFVLYTACNRAVWSTGTSGRPGSRLEMRDDGNLVIYGLTGNAYWASNSVTASSGRISEEPNLALLFNDVNATLIEDMPSQEFEDDINEFE